MPRPLTKDQWHARAVAYEEAAEHLDLDWTDDADEREQGKIITQRLHDEARLCRARAAELL